MTEQEFAAIKERWRGPGVGIDDRAQNDIAKLLAEVQFLRGLLADLCQDSRAAEEASRLRTFLADLSQSIDRFVDDLERQVQGLEWRGEVIGLKAVAQLNGLKALVLRGLERGQS